MKFNHSRPLPCQNLPDFLSKPEAFANKGVRYRVRCADGYNVSIQYSAEHNCEFDSLEIGMPSEIDPELEEFDTGDNCVFSYVPIPVMETVVARHGGIVEQVSIRGFGDIEKAIELDAQLKQKLHYMLLQLNEDENRKDNKGRFVIKEIDARYFKDKLIEINPRVFFENFFVVEKW